MRTQIQRKGWQADTTKSELQVYKSTVQNPKTGMSKSTNKQTKNAGPKRGMMSAFPMDFNFTMDFNSPPTQPALFTPLHVRRQLSKLPPVRLQALMVSAHGFSELCGILHHVLDMSLSLQRVPVIWKTSCLVPVPKMPQPSGLSGYRLVALTSHIMKTLERLALEQLRPMVSLHLDPLHFAYQSQIGVEDAIIYLLNRVYAHLDKLGSTVRVRFFDFSNAFNTIRPALLGDKLMAMLVDPPFVSWIVDYLTGRP